MITCTYVSTSTRGAHAHLPNLALMGSQYALALVGADMCSFVIRDFHMSQTAATFMSSAMPTCKRA